jgi:cytochrome P450
MVRLRASALVRGVCFWRFEHGLIEQVLVTDAKHYIKHFGARPFKPVLGNALVTSEGAFWHRQRKLIQPAFLKARVRSYAPIMVELTKQMLESWTPGKSVRIDYEFESLTSKIALKTLFDLVDPGEANRLIAIQPRPYTPSCLSELSSQHQPNRSRLCSQ